MDYHNKRERKEQSVFEESVLAGRRKYFFDICNTSEGKFFLKLTERRRARPDDYGRRESERSTLHIYQEDMEKFYNAVNNCFHKMRELIPNFDSVQFRKREFDPEDDNNA